MTTDDFLNRLVSIQIPATVSFLDPLGTKLDIVETAISPSITASHVSDGIRHISYTFSTVEKAKRFKEALKGLGIKVTQEK